MKNEIKKVKKTVKKKYNSVMHSIAKKLVKLETAMDNNRKVRLIKKKKAAAKKAAVAPIKPKNNLVSINTAGFSKEQLSDIRQLVLDIRAENAKKCSIVEPKAGQIYYIINTDSAIVEDRLADGGSNDKFNGKIGNAFTTKYAAELAIEKMKIRAELERFAEKHNYDITPGRYFYIFMENIKGNDILSVSEYTEKVQGAVLFSSDSIAELAIKEIGAEKIKKLFY